MRLKRMAAFSLEKDMRKCPYLFSLHCAIITKFVCQVRVHAMKKMRIFQILQNSHHQTVYRGGYLEHYVFSNSNIDLACEETGRFLLAAGVDQREALRIKLTFEEVLLKYQKKFGEDGRFRVRRTKRFSSIKVEIVVAGESYDALGKENEEDDVLHALLAGIGLAPFWSYRHRKNYIVFIPKKKPSF